MTDQDWIAAAREKILDASRRKSCLAIRGHGSKDFYGLPSKGKELFSTLPYCGIVDYDPTELVVVVKSGTPITELEAKLGASRQMLAFEPPRFGGKGTVGGMVACGLSGPRRMSAGSVKDFILGMTVMDAAGNMLRYGGTVMKNVAGYDLSRLHTGAFGTLGLIVDVSIKVLPLAPAEATLSLQMPADRAITVVNEWGGQPLPISAISWRNDNLMVRLAGAQAAVKSAIAKIGGELVIESQAQQFWKSLRDQEDSFFALDAADATTNLWRISVPSVTPPMQNLQGDWWMEWGCGLRWLKTSQGATQVRDRTKACGGHATLYRSTTEDLRQSAGVFSELPPAIMKIHHRLKKELDPQKLFNPGRMYAAL